MWLALALTGLGWASTTALLLWQLGRIKAALTASESKVSVLALEVVGLREHIGMQSAIYEQWHVAALEHNARMEGSINALRDSNRFAMQTLKDLLSRPDVPAHLAGELSASVLSTGPTTSTTATAPRAGSGEGAFVPPTTRPPARGPAGGG